MQPIVIVGSGLAGYTLLKEFRKRDRETPVTLISRDDGAFYSKPNLSNALAANRTAAELVGASAEKMAADLGATVLTHTEIEAIDTATRRLRYSGGGIEYARLVLALGADTLAHGLGGAVLTVNDLADYARFRAAIEDKVRVAVLGGGLIGCEFANDLVQAGYAVEVVHAGAWPLDRLLPAEAGRRLSDALARLGVQWHFGRRAKALLRAGAGYALVLDDGGRIETDVVLSAIGLKPRIALAKAAGIATGHGITVDRRLQTSAPGIYAVGDCAEVDGVNLPFVQPLMAQARALAATLAGEIAEVNYPPMPVLVKTPAHPVVALPPAPGSEGRWRIESGTGGVCALYVDAADRVQGFALTGSETAHRASLVQSMTA